MAALKRLDAMAGRFLSLGRPSDRALATQIVELARSQDLAGLETLRLTK